VKTIDEYAIELVTDGAESVAEDDLNEDEDIAEDEHEEACVLAIEMAHAIENNQAAFLAWFQSVRPVKA
jgi:hypothetical protein